MSVVIVFGPPRAGEDMSHGDREEWCRWRTEHRKYSEAAGSRLGGLERGVRVAAGTCVRMAVGGGACRIVGSGAKAADLRL